MSKQKLILIDGSPASGKSRITKLIRENRPHTTLLSLSSISEDRKETSYLYHSSVMNMILDCNGFGCDFVADRTFLTNQVYSLLGLKDYDYTEEYEWLCDKLKYLTHFYDIHLFILATNEENYAKRLSKRDKFQYIKHSAENSMKQQRKYMELADDIRDKNLGISVHTINNTGTTPEQTLELIMSMI